MQATASSRACLWLTRRAITRARIAQISPDDEARFRIVSGRDERRLIQSPVSAPDASSARNASIAVRSWRSIDSAIKRSIALQRSEENTSELPSLMRHSLDGFY